MIAVSVPVQNTHHLFLSCLPLLLHVKNNFGLLPEKGNIYQWGHTSSGDQDFPSVYWDLLTTHLAMGQKVKNLAMGNSWPKILLGSIQNE